MRRHIIIAASAVVLAGACDRVDSEGGGMGLRGERAEEAKSSEQQKPAGLAEVKRAVAVIEPTEGSDVRGTVQFEQRGDRTHVKVDISGLEPNSKHGFHIHELGDCSAPDAKSAGDHYDPDEHRHALPDQGPRHAGDMGNLIADAQGRSQYEATFDNFTLAGAKAPVVGRAVIVHAQPDMGESAQPSGNAGARLGCGVIGIRG